MYTGNTQRGIVDAEDYPGLSLCIQGTLRLVQHIYSATRFIPVYTGNTALDIRAIVTTSVYPCVYREHSIHMPDMGCICGLSLCIQGTL